MTTMNLTAGGTINPAVFVKLSTSADHTALQASTGDFVVGVSTPSQKYAPTTENSSNTMAAESGDNIMLFGLGDICRLQAGSGGFTRGDLLKSDSSGRGVTAATTDYYGAIALESTSINNFGRVQVLIGYKK